MYHDTRRKDPDIEYLEDELQRYREHEQRGIEEAKRRRRDREKKRMEREAYEMRTAKTWPEALRKQVFLMTEEASYEAAENFKYSSFFTNSINACNRALVIWQEVEVSKQERITELKRQLKGIQDEIRLETAKRLHSENESYEWRGISSSIENDENLNDWLNW